MAVLVAWGQTVPKPRRERHPAVAAVPLTFFLVVALPSPSPAAAVVAADMSLQASLRG